MENPTLPFVVPFAYFDLGNIYETRPFNPGSRRWFLRSCR